MTQNIYSRASAAVGASGGDSGLLNWGQFAAISVDVNVTAHSGTSPTLTVYLDRLGADGVFYNIWTSDPITAATDSISLNVGPGMPTNRVLNSQGRLRWAVGGSSTPTKTFSASVQGVK